MKSFSLVLVLASSCAAVVIPIENNSTYHRLEVRAGQQLTNPDNEPPYQDPVSGDSVEKSRVLSGVGPAAADSRYFDWDESCTDAGQREKIVLAWDAFQDLVTSSSQRLGDLSARLPNQLSNKPNEGNRKFIMAEDQAYTQMFDARDIGLAWVQGSYDTITNNVKNFPGRGGGTNPPALRFICNADDHVKDGDGNPYCGSGDTAADASTLVPQSNADTNIEPKYRLSTATSITFCPRFFDDSKLPNMDSIWNNDQTTPNLDEVDCRERVMLHEYLHLPWTRNFRLRPGQDARGYRQANRVATFTWAQNKKMPDCYAWYTLYSAYNNRREGCGSDVWPAGVKKLIVK